MKYALIGFVFFFIGCASNLSGVKDVYQLQVVNYATGSSGICTAFMVDKDVALTAGHCYWKCHQSACVSQLVGKDKGVREVLFADNANVADYASVIVQPVNGDDVWEISETPPVVDDNLCYKTARPGNEQQEFCGKVVNVAFGVADVKVKADFGSSGSPVYNEDGKVVGILTKITSDGRMRAQLINKIVRIN